MCPLLAQRTKYKIKCSEDCQVVLAKLIETYETHFFVVSEAGLEILDKVL